MSTLSGISSRSVPGRMLLSRNASSTLSMNSGLENSLHEIFTDRSSGRPNICCHAAT